MDVLAGASGKSMNTTAARSVPVEGALSFRVHVVGRQFIPAEGTLVELGEAVLSVEEVGSDVACDSVAVVTEYGGGQELPRGKASVPIAHPWIRKERVVAKCMI